MTNNFNYWELVLDNLKTKISSSNYQAWFSDIEFDALNNEGRKIILRAPSEFHKSYIEKKFNTELREAINKYYPKVIHLEIKLKPNGTVVSTKTKKQIQDPLDLQVAKDRKKSAKEEPQTVETQTEFPSYLPRKNINNLNPRYTFENLIVTKSNEFTVNLCKGVVNELGTLYNPLFIYAPVGLGKTHLIQAVGHKVLEQNPSLHIKYVPSDTFFNQFYLALTKGEAEKFRNYYSSIDLLLVDDIQFIGGKEGFQNELFHLFNLLHQANKQIIFTSDRTPKDLIGVEDRLVSRFEWGMVTDIQRPDIDDRMAILKNKLEQHGVTLSQEHMYLVAEKVDTNIRELEGIINKIKAIINVSSDKSITDRALLQILSQYLKQKPNAAELDKISTITPEKINLAITRIFGITENELNGTSRRKDIAVARQFAFYLYKDVLDLSYPHIGKFFGGRDHTTIMHGCRKVDMLIKKGDQKTITKLNLLKELLKTL